MAGEPNYINRPAAHQPTASKTSASNTAATITLAAPSITGEAWHIGQLVWSCDGTPATNITMTDGTTSIGLDITNSGPGSVPFDPALRFACNGAVTITTAAAGTGVITKTTVMAWKASN